MAGQSWNLDPVGNRSRQGVGRCRTKDGSPSKARVRSHAKHNWDETSHDGVTELRQHNAVNELVHRDNALTTALVYCDSGNLIEDHEHKYTYDAFNRLVEVADKATGQTIATYRYDTQNRRIKRIVENSGNLNGTTQYIYDSWQVVEERDGQGQIEIEYTYGNYIDEPITLTTSTGTFYYHAIGVGPEQIF